MSEPVRCWLVERAFDDKGLVTLTYATLAGDRVYRRELAAAAASGSTVTAAKDVPADRLDPVDDDARRDRFAAEAERTAERYGPDEPI